MLRRNRYALGWGQCSFGLSLLATSLACSSLAAAAQTTIHVPADQSTIQAAINAANNGDTVMVSPGTYNENIDFKGKGITVTTQTGLLADAAATVLSGIGGGPVVNFGSAEPATAKLAGFSIANSTKVAISVSAGSPTITNDLISGGQGCGIVISGSQSSPTVADNEIRNLSFPQGVTCGDAGGAAISVSNAGNVSIKGNSIHDIDTTAKGINMPAGVNVGSASVFAPSNIYLANNVIRNTVSNGAPALYANVNGTFVMVQNEIYDNTGGGGVEIMGEGSGAFHPGTFSATAVNNTLYGNTFGGNVVPTYGEQLYSSGIFVSFVAKNNIFRSADAYAAVTCDVINSSNATFANNDVSDEGASSPPICTGVTSQNNLYSDPQFVNPANGDFHTQRTSPVVAAGDINAPDIPSTDYDKRNRTVCGTIDMGVYEVHPIPPIALTVSPNPAPGQSSVTLTATLTGNCNTPTGLITFMDGSTVLGTASLNGNAVATFRTSFLFVGTHNLTATYPGDFNFAPSTSNTITEVITGPPTITVLNSVSPNPALPFQPIMMTATVSSAYTVPAGTITFMTGGKALATATLAANGTASATISTLGAGTYPITAVYGGSTEYASSTSNTVIEVVNGAPTTTALTSSLNPSSFGQTVTFTATVAAPQSTTTPTGIVTFMDGATTLGSATLSAADVAQFSTSSLAAGSHSITAVFGGSTNDAKSTSNTVVQIVNLDTASLSLTSSLNPADVGQSITFTATASGIVLGATPDTVIFYDGTNPIGTAALSTTGVTSISTSSLALGTHSITATLAATTTHNSATSAPVSEVVVQPGFSFTGFSITLLAGHSGTGDLELASLNSFTGNVAVTCNPPFPPNYTCRLQYSSISLTAGLSEVFTYTLKPTGTARTADPNLFSNSSRIVFASLFPLTLLSLIGLARKRRTILRTLLSLTLLAILASATTACGPDHFIPNTTVTYPITFTATGTTQGTTVPITHSVTVNVTVAP